MSPDSGLPVMKKSRWTTPGALQFLFTGAVILGLAVLYALVDPGRTPVFLQCPFHTLTGFSCPGCGSQRAFHALLNGHLVQALSHNLLTISLLLPLVVYAYAAWGANALFGRPLPPVPRRLLPPLVALLVLFGILRNIPFQPFTWLQP